MTKANSIFNSYTDPIPPLRYDVSMTPIEQDGEHYLYFQDQLGYVAADFAVPRSARDVFSLIDGNRSIENILEFTSDDIGKEQVLEYIQFLDSKGLLHSAYLKQRIEEIESAYETSSSHPSNTAGFSYPEDREELEYFLNEAFEKLPKADPEPKAHALYAPHIDIRVGLNSYVKAFSAIQELQPERVVILATSHYSGLFPDLYEDHPFIISQKEFKMPNGTVSPDHKAIEEIRKKVQGKEEEYGVSFKDRAHRVEHSIEMHLVFLNHIWKHDFSVIPILIGGLDELFYKKDGFRGQQVQQFSQLIHEQFGQDRNTFFLISGDLAHIGKKFGDEQPAQQLYDDVRPFDRKFLDLGAKGDAHALLELMSAQYDPYRTCGYPPLYTFLHGKPVSGGKVITYDVWDETERESGVSFGSILYHE